MRDYEINLVEVNVSHTQRGTGELVVCVWRYGSSIDWRLIRRTGDLGKDCPACLHCICTNWFIFFFPFLWRSRACLTLMKFVVQVLKHCGSMRFVVQVLKHCCLMKTVRCCAWWGRWGSRWGPSHSPEKRVCCVLGCLCGVVLLCLLCVLCVVYSHPISFPLYLFIV